MSYNDSRIRKIQWKKRISHLSIYFRISIVSVDKLGYPQKKSTMSHIRTSVPQDVLCQYVDNVFKRACAICKIYIIHWFKIFEWFESIFIVKSLSRNVKRFKNIKQNEFNLNIEIDKIKTKYSKFYQLDWNLWNFRGVSNQNPRPTMVFALEKKKFPHNGSDFVSDRFWVHFRLIVVDYNQNCHCCRALHNEWCRIVKCLRQKCGAHPILMWKIRASLKGIKYSGFFIEF